MSSQQLATPVKKLCSFRRALPFVLVGGLGALVDSAILVGLVEQFAIWPTAAAIASKEVSIIVMFLANEHWTFADATTGNPIRRFLRSNLVRSGGVIIGVSVLYVLTEWGNMWYLAANIIGIGVGFFSNYTFESLITWQIHR